MSMPVVIWTEAMANIGWRPVACQSLIENQPTSCGFFQVMAFDMGFGRPI